MAICPSHTFLCIVQLTPLFLSLPVLSKTQLVHHLAQWPNMYSIVKENQYKFINNIILKGAFKRKCVCHRTVCFCDVLISYVEAGPTEHILLLLLVLVFHHPLLTSRNYRRTTIELNTTTICEANTRYLP